MEVKDAPRRVREAWTPRRAELQRIARAEKRARPEAANADRAKWAAVDARAASNGARLSHRGLVHIIAAYLGVSDAEVWSASRRRKSTRCRQIAWYFTRVDRPQISSNQIGRVFKMDHSSVLYGVDRIKCLIASDERLREQVAELYEIVRSSGKWP
jgi:chromosomal replication initiation ATPase DnaA